MDYEYCIDPYGATATSSIIWNGWTDTTTTDVWPGWVSAAYASTSSCTNTNVIYWPHWVQDATDSTATNIWSGWATMRIVVNTQIVTPAVRVPTPEELAAEAADRERRRKGYEAERIAEAADRERRRKEYEAERIAAEAVAAKLLAEYLTPEQRAEFERHQYFHLHVGGKRYRIRHGSHGNVRLVDEKGIEVESYCINPTGDERVPIHDAVLAQKLLLEHNEKEFLRIANRTRLTA